MLVLSKLRNIQRKPTAHLLNFSKKLILKSFGFTKTLKDRNEDNYFLTKNVFGIFDGVGGWARSGGRSDLYSADLSKHCKAGVETKALLDPLKVLEYGFSKADQSVRGTTTAVIASVDEKVLSVINLGDSGCLLVRNNDAVFMSSEQQHSFNYPFQIGTRSKSRPKDGDRYSFPILPGDKFLLYTDGISDNIFKKELVEHCSDNSKSIKQIATGLVNKALERGLDRNFVSPFQVKARMDGHNFKGGKLDDCTVVLVSVHEEK
ncbi:protein phosphatase ptc7 [Anaeramoeba flamelloides]|uniref:Protein phosphatase n=1 Tax=Anaeramoeba flamelloides TaxID=1746091 RepID=A0AAV7YTL4_9EUKA|nr:protein phosphatase ptc7 [Anaeramoeba flamelloides]KAJ6241982.1 protein phosphatase ptc7 [Anaeramoeba flamelloides]|eukprot:Anaeramoba_flamelloidesa333031_86.p1 GENE.a333031_86~~a333031_86.p1  ORF type:complete len:262 (+),score=58.34 a333031_86:27-812(+)